MSFLKSLPILPLVLSLLSCLTGCDEKASPHNIMPPPDSQEVKKSDAKTVKAQSDDKKDRKGKGKKDKGDDGPRKDVAKPIEEFTGAHTRLVWAECVKAEMGDTFAVSDQLVLKGIDTKDGKFERKILEKQGNYSRPLLSWEGTVILYTDKNVERKDGLKHYHPVIYRTDWVSGKAEKLGEGYAVDTWKDPATGTEWVYAVQDIRPTKGISLEGAKLVRFPLNDASKVEAVYSDTPVSTDNIQLSRSGKMACGLFPWPHAGVFEIENNVWTPTKLITGCWPSLAPDDSGVSWVFDGGHRSCYFFADEGAKFWELAFNGAPRTEGHELYHPRWSNHARFFVITGPYVKEKNSSGSVINKGGGSAQIIVGKFSPAADKVEAWLQITGDDKGESYPDMWVEGGDKANLDGYSIAKKSPGAAPAIAWPSDKSGLLFLWKDRESLNAFTSRDGKKHETRLEAHGAGRFGRFRDLRLDGGIFELEAEAAMASLAALKAQPEVAFQALVLPETATPDQAFIARAPGLQIGTQGGLLTLVSATGPVLKTTAPLPAKPFHLAVNRRKYGIDAYVNGIPVPLQPDASAPVPASFETLTLGGNWNGGLLQVAWHDAILDEDKIASDSQAAAARIARFPEAPPRVKVLAKLVEVSAMPTPEGIDPYTGALVSYVYEVEKVLEGTLTEPRILVKHWAMLDKLPVSGLPRTIGSSHELILEQESAHPELKGERVMEDENIPFDLVPWFDVSSPKLGAAP